MLPEISPEVISTTTNESKCHVMDARTVTDKSKFEILAFIGFKIGNCRDYARLRFMFVPSSDIYADIVCCKYQQTEDIPSSQIK